MQKIRLGRSDLEVSRICLGSMTWGSQNTPEEGWAQIDRALERGVDFIDTAEMYPTTPLSNDTFGGTEEIIGGWVERSGRRGDVAMVEPRRRAPRPRQSLRVARASAGAAGLRAVGDAAAALAPQRRIACDGAGTRPRSARRGAALNGRARDILENGTGSMHRRQRRTILVLEPATAGATMGVRAGR